MHEMSIMISLLRAVEGKVNEVGGGKVKAIRVAVGALSGVEPAFLETAFEFLSPGTVVDGAAFVIHVPAMRMRCRSCGKDLDINEISLTCPACGSNDIEIDGGEELLIEEMEVEFGDSKGVGLRENPEGK